MTGDHDIHFIIASCLICVTTVINVTLSSKNPPCKKARTNLSCEPAYV